tara:strand:- start:536 stop:655 length:120 start_codon:yes stop_codon:yes gene_type:complete
MRKSGQQGSGGFLECLWACKHCTAGQHQTGNEAAEAAVI